MELLNELIKKTGAKVVITSTWRLSRSVEELQRVLDYKGFEGEVIAKTPYFHAVLSGVSVQYTDVTERASGIASL